ncbi:hypothetical protein TSAR_002441 [Trichomalopsis sarcophagae]|uniref:Serpin domain-containing protein n=1 Tax=Trichomalopsis sarcophagae TaxID=543379 RepID=A0A232FGH6_9HYME|nr:hypothetical protein TSAR_002441 [Trichomalopsis sarcophagae]
MAEDKAVEPLKAVSEGTGLFATNFFKKVSADNKGKNLISSPLSAHVVLSMAAFGAGGNTAVQMRQSLHMPADDVVSKQGYENLIDTLNNVENVTLEVANKMYLANNLKLKSDYKSLTSGTFRSEAAEIDTSKPAESAKVINDWVDEKTHHKINGIVKEDDITSDTRMLLLNAVYFKGKWAKEFKKEGTQDRVFHVDGKTEKKVPTMFASGSYVYGELPDLKAKFVELPYENKDLKMVIIVPDEIEGLSAIQENLESFNYTRLAEAGSEREVQLYIPKFKIESTIDLQKPLEARLGEINVVLMLYRRLQLGMTDMFSNAANFTGISDEPLKVGKVLQKAFIEVNEEGSEAAAVTDMELEYRTGHDETVVIVNRPFYFVISSNGINNSIFVGQFCVQAPTDGGPTVSLRDSRQEDQSHALYRTSPFRAITYSAYNPKRVVADRPFIFQIVDNRSKVTIFTIKAIVITAAFGPDLQMELKADRPFAFQIVHEQSKVALFTGSLNDPNQPFRTIWSTTNRPFFFMIYDIKANIPIFTGSITNPSIIKLRPVSALLYEEEPTIINVDRPFAFGIFDHNTKTILFSGYIILELSCWLQSLLTKMKHYTWIDQLEAAPASAQIIFDPPTLVKLDRPFFFALCKVIMMPMALPIFISTPPKIIADRPFFFQIVDNRTNVNLFVGFVLHPAVIRKSRPKKKKIEVNRPFYYMIHVGIIADSIVRTYDFEADRSFLYRIEDTRNNIVLFEGLVRDPTL